MGSPQLDGGPSMENPKKKMDAFGGTTIFQESSISGSALVAIVDKT